MEKNCIEIFISFDEPEKVYEISIPVNASIRYSVESVVSKLGLPKYDNVGSPIIYILAMPSNDEEPDVLEFDDEDGKEQTLADYNVHSGDKLYLMSLLVAGGSPDVCEDEYDISPTLPNPIEQSSNDFSSRKNEKPHSFSYHSKENKPSFFQRIFGKKSKSVMASAYAPAMIEPRTNFMIRIFIHRPEETTSIDSLVDDVDDKAVKKANKPLDITVKDGDKVTVILKMPDGIRIDEPLQTFNWRGHYMEFDFICNLAVQMSCENISAKAIIAVNNVPAGELKFIIEIGYQSSNRYTEVSPKRYSKIFISYAHADYQQVRCIAEGCKMNGSDYFFDRHTLRAGDIFKEKILEYIDKADLFVLCWSKNAAESEWVQIERKHALNLMQEGTHKLEIYPLSIPPEAPLPSDMSDKYNFATL